MYHPALTDSRRDMRQLLGAAVFALFLWVPAAQAQFVDPSLPWRSLDTEHFSVHFAEQLRGPAQLVAQTAESVYPRITAWLRWRPASRTHIVVLDSLDFANGLASPVPFNYIQIVLTPPDEGELLQNREWLELVLTHEFTHIAHLDKATDDPLALRRIFGRFQLLFPNLLEPGWVTEGLAVYSESDPVRGWGRLGQSQFEGQMRAEAVRGLRSLREVNAEGRGFPLNRDYLYGGYFFDFLTERYGPSAPIDYVEGYSDNLVPFRVDSNPARLTGKHMDELWEEYHAWLRARFGAKAAPGPRDEGGEIFARAWSLDSPQLAPDGTRWYVAGDGYTLPRLMRASPGGPAVAVSEVESQTRVAVLPSGEALLSKPEICGDYNPYYDLYRVGADGTLARMTECGRYRFAAPLADGRIAAIRVTGGVAEVVLLAADGREERVLYRAAEGEALTGLAAKADRVAVTSLRGERWSLLELADGKASVLLSDGSVKLQPRYGESGDEIYFVADYGKVDNVWSWRRSGRRLARWSDALSGVLDISAPVSGQMLVKTLEADDYALRLLRLTDAPLELREAAQPQPAPSRLPGASAEPDRPYSPWSSLLPTSWLPAFYIADGAFALGFQTYGQDALGLHLYTLAPLYEFTQEQGLGSASYVYNDRHGGFINRSMTVKTSVADNQAFTGRDVRAYNIDETAQWVSLWRRVRLATQVYAGAGAALDRETFHDLGVGTSDARNERVLGLVAGVDTRRTQFLSEGPSQGQQLRLFAETSNGLHGTYTGNFYRYDWRGYVPAGATVFALRLNQAYSQAGAEPIQLGGSFSEEVAGFDLPVLDQRQFPLRGYRSGEPALTGRHAVLGTFEWRTPLADIDRHLMVPPVGLDRLSLTVFLETGSAWNDAALQRYFRSGGLELLSELRLGYLLPLQLRAGVAKGFEAPGMTVGYLKIGRSF
jgi:hypothetical protein